MPRIKSRKKIYMQNDIGAWISGKMREKKLTQADIADCMGITQQAFGQKLKKSQFTYGDLLTIFQVMEITDADILKLMKI